MKAKKLLVVAGFVCVLAPALAASAMMGKGHGLDVVGDRMQQGLNGALALIGLPGAATDRGLPVVEGGEVRQPFVRQPQHRGFSFAHLIRPNLGRFNLDGPSEESRGLDGWPGGLAMAGEPSNAAFGPAAVGTAQDGAVGAGVSGPGGSGAGATGMSAALVGGGLGGPSSDGSAEKEAFLDLGTDSQEGSVVHAPLPASVWFMLAGLVGLGFIGWRRNR